MICKSCNHYNKDTASVCRFCGSHLQGGPVKAEEFLKNSQPIRRSNSFNGAAPKGEDFLRGNLGNKNNRPSFGNAPEQSKNSNYFQSINPIPKTLSYDDPRNAESSRDKARVRPKNSILTAGTAKPLKSNVFLHTETDRPGSSAEKHNSKTQEAKEKTAVFQESLFNKKFSWTLLLLSFITLVFIIAFTFVFIDKNYSDNSKRPSASHSAAVSSHTSAKVSPTITATPIATTKPE